MLDVFYLVLGVAGFYALWLVTAFCRFSRSSA
jgi:hypothetical protein